MNTALKPENPPSLRGTEPTSFKMSATPQPPPPPTPSNASRATTVPLPTYALQQPSNKAKNPSKSTKLFRRFRSVFGSFPIMAPSCKIPVSLRDGHIHAGTRITGTLFGHRKARINLAIQENPRSLPILVLELAMPTGKLLQDMGMGLVRMALECEKKPADKIKIIDEPIWTMYCNGRKSGYGVKREPTAEDLMVMQLLHVVSMGAGVVPNNGDEHREGEFAYMRASFERVVGSKDSETYYMLNPDGNSPELSIFFVRI